MSGLDRWMEMTADDATGDQTIQLKQCPRCRVAIRRNLRYGTIINQLLADIELVSRARRNRSGRPAAAAGPVI